MNALVSLLTLLAVSAPGEKPEASAPCNETICERDLRADLFFLADDAFNAA